MSLKTNMNRFHFIMISSTEIHIFLKHFKYILNKFREIAVTNTPIQTNLEKKCSL